MTKRFTYRGVRIEIWQGNDNESQRGWLPWFWRPTNERGERLRINWQILGPFTGAAAARANAKGTIDRILDWYPVR